LKADVIFTGAQTNPFPYYRAMDLFLLPSREDPFPLVMTDIYMGKMTGIDLLQEIRVQDSDAMVVVMTSHASLETATMALRNGAYDYLVKPFDDIDMISAVVGRAIDRSRLNAANRALMADLKRNAEQLEQLNAKLTDMANRDGLTGLYNHRYLRETLDQELSRSRRHGREFSLLFLDIDHFKHYNDTHGHLAGDNLLCTLATLLHERSRGETLAARYGGEEFVLLVPESGSPAALRYAEILREMVAEHPFPGRETQQFGCVTISVGVATFPEAGKDATTLIDHADKALYASKNSGRNRVSVWTPPRT
jgi:diguanylate cyclase (GGDEF)-like protein